jgi:archaemetzincin
VNGSNNLDENDSRPLHVCPVCLRKLHSSIGFAPFERDRNLLLLYRQLGLDRDADWLERRQAAATMSPQ